MAKSKNRIIIKLVSTAGTGYYYTTTRHRLKDKMVMRKFDPVIRQYVDFKEAKVK